MEADSAEISLSTQELQVLSELDSRQFGFLKLTSPEYAKKRGLVIKAVKYLERMLIQAQNQKEHRSRHSKGTSNHSEYGSVSGDVNSTSVNAVNNSKDEEVKVKTEYEDVEMDEQNNDGRASKDASNTISTSNMEIKLEEMPIKIEDVETTNISADTDSLVDSEKEISIDPRTYCKLGHFHLLLEDFPKALSAYQKYFGLQEAYWKDQPFLYGLAMVYFHFNAYKWEINLVHKIIEDNRRDIWSMEASYGKKMFKYV